jgi:hypothetical protein
LQLTYVWSLDQLKQFALIAKLTGILIQSKKTFFLYGCADGQPMYHVPNELSCLQEGEKLLIQMVSPYVPFVHIKNGTLGIKGLCLLISSKSTGCLYNPSQASKLSNFCQDG